MFFHRKNTPFQTITVRIIPHWDSFCQEFLQIWRGAEPALADAYESFRVIGSFLFRGAEPALAFRVGEYTGKESALLAARVQ
jgi:hypothetical protein